MIESVGIMNWKYVSKDQKLPTSSKRVENEVVAEETFEPVGENAFLLCSALLYLLPPLSPRISSPFSPHSSSSLLILPLSSSSFFFSPHPSFSSLLIPLPYSSFLILLLPSSLLILPLCSSFFFSPHPSIAALAPLEVEQALGLVQVPCHHQPLWQEEGGHQGEEEEGVFILFCCPSVWSDVDATNYLTTLSLYLLN